MLKINRCKTKQPIYPSFPPAESQSTNPLVTPYPSSFFSFPYFYTLTKLSFLFVLCHLFLVTGYMLKTQQKKESYCSFQYLACQEPAASGKLNQLLEKFPSFQLFSRKVGERLQPTFPKKKSAHTAVN